MRNPLSSSNEHGTNMKSTWSQIYYSRNIHIKTSYRSHVIYTSFYDESEMILLWILYWGDLSESITISSLDSFSLQPELITLELEIKPASYVDLFQQVLEMIKSFSNDNDKWPWKGPFGWMNERKARREIKRDVW